MRIKYVRNHNSIGQFSPIDTPDFTILTGVNGSGKTHLMQAIKAGSVIVDAIPAHDIGYYTYNDFLAPNPKTLNSQQIEAQVQSTWQHFTGAQGNPKVNWRSSLANLHNQNFIVNENGKKTDLIQLHLPEDMSIWDVSRHPDLVDPKLILPTQKFIQSVKQQVFANANFKKIPYHISLIKALRKTGRNFHQITETEFRDRFIPSTQTTNHLTSSLGVIFTKYLVDQFLWAHRQWEVSSRSATREELYREYEDTYEKPWDIINEILDEIHAFANEASVFNFAVTTPSGHQLRMENWQSYSFVPTLIDKNDRSTRQFELLSSGEKVLLALAISIYESRDDFALPELLLLDEIDASLHPSMTRALLQTIQEVFVNRGIKVVLATHSPSTVALAPADSVHVVHKGRPTIKLEHKPNKEALELLTEGFATLERGLTVFDEIAAHDLNIITEGKNTKYIEKALSLFDRTDVAVVSGIEAVSGKDQLKTLFRIFCAAPFTKPILFVWDCDVTFNLQDNNNTFALILPKNESNTVCPKGIENMFPEHLFDQFINETKESRGNVIRVFDYQRKQDFEDHVLKNAANEDFHSFQVLIDKLEEICPSR